MALSTQELTQLQDLLTAREEFLKQDIEREVSNREEYIQVAGEAPDTGDHSVADLILDTNRTEVTRDIDELNEIADAFARIQDGRYGLCNDCGSGIPFARLKVQPAASRCVDCQGLYEKTYAQESGTPSL